MEWSDAAARYAFFALRDSDFFVACYYQPSKELLSRSLVAPAPPLVDSLYYVSSLRTSDRRIRLVVVSVLLHHLATTDVLADESVRPVTA